MYDSFSQEYDHFVNWPNRLAFELPFLMEQINSAVDKPAELIRVLDIATGTGMHAIALAQKGYNASGMDISEGMVTIARQNAAAVNADVFFTTAAFGNVAERSKLIPEGKGCPFDAILCLGNSLPHAEDINALQTALRDFSTCLHAGGLLILQNRNFDNVLDKKERWMEPQSYKNENGESVFLRFYDFLPDGHIQFNIITLKQTAEGQWNQSIMETRLFPITRDILMTALEGSGFTRVKVYGALSNTPFDSQTSGNLVITAVKK
jgi:2-polyprenyl-3-methyl-5-hydroxy-6-metoxy-1,4-benzoquinol methylase